MTKHAIVTTPIDDKYKTLEHLCSTAVECGVTHVWVDASTGIKITPDEYQRLGSEWVTKPNWEIKKQEVADAMGSNTLVSLVGRKVYQNGSQSHRFNIIFLQYTRWGWNSLDANQIQDIINLIEGRLGVTLTGSPANAGMNYLQKVLSEHHPKWLERPEADLSVFRFTKPLVWHRIPSANELACKYLYSVDKNSAWPRAAKAEKFGIGEPVHSGAREFDAKLPGMWKIDVLHSPDLDERLPHPLHRIEGLEWLPTQIVKLLVSMGCEIAVKEAWVFPRSEYVFKRWVENLWAFSNEFERGTVERSSLKKIMNEGCGITGSSLVTDSFKNRPDFASQIISAARAVMYYNIIKYAKLGYYPILVQTDEIFYLSNAETIEEAVPGIIDLSESLGGYKLKYRIPLDATFRGEAIREILASNRGQTYKKQACNAVAGDDE